MAKFLVKMKQISYSLIDIQIIYTDKYLNVLPTAYYIANVII